MNAENRLHSSISRSSEGRTFPDPLALTPLIGEVPRKTNYLTTFHVNEITKPLSLAEEESLANEIVNNILQQEKEKEDRYKLPEHLDQIKRLLDPPSKVKKKLPIISQLSPRTKSKLATIPKPNDFELQEIRNIEKLTKKAGPQFIYQEINKKRPASRLDPISANKIDLLFEDDTEQKLANPLLDPRQNVKYGKIVPNDTVAVQVEDHTTGYFKQADRFRQHKQKQSEILRSLLGPDEVLDNPPPLEPVGDQPIFPSSSHGPRTAKTAASTSRLRMQQSASSSALGSTTLPAPVLPGLLNPVANQRRQQLEQRQEQDFLNSFSARVFDEIGVDLNKQYNRVRKYRSALRVFYYYAYVWSVSSAMRTWKRATEEMRRLVMQRAGWKIVSVLRRRVYQRFRERKLHNEHLQRANEQQRILQNRLFLRRNAQIVCRALFRYWKLVKIRRALQRRRSTVHIQRGVRGFIARRKYQKKLAFMAFLRDNATVIQCMYRRHLARRTVMLRRKLKFIADYVQFLETRRLHHEKDFHQLGAVSRIVQSFRLFQMKKRLGNMLYWMRYSKVIVIQRHVRGHLVRTKNKNFRQARLRRQKLEQSSAVVLQKFFRRLVAEQKLVRLLEERELEKNRHHQEKLFKLAAGLTPFQKFKMRLVRLYRSLRPFRYIVLNEKAVVIQRVYRGYHGRQRMKFVRIHAALQEFYKKRRLQTKQAVKIQRIWRGYSTRKKLLQRRKQKMVVKLQCFARKFLSYKRYKRLKMLHDNARKLTFLIRRLLKRHKFRRKFQREQLLGSVVIFLQNFFRQRHAVFLRRQLALERARETERRLACQTRLVHLLARIELRILAETIAKPINKRYYVLSKADCLCFGPLQAIFVLFACGQTSKGRMELATLSLNQLDNSHFLKFLGRLPHFMVDKGKKPAAEGKKRKLLQDEDDAPDEHVAEPLCLNGFHPLHVSAAAKEAAYAQYAGLVNIMPRPRPDSKYALPARRPRSGGRPLSSRQASPPKLQRGKSVKGGRGLLTRQPSALGKTPATGGSGKKEAEPEEKPTAARQSALLTVLSAGDWPVPPIRHLLTPTEFDILYGRSKAEGNASNKISFAEFRECLRFLCEVHFHSADVNINRRLHVRLQAEQLAAAAPPSPLALLVPGADGERADGDEDGRTNSEPSTRPPSPAPANGTDPPTPSETAAPEAPPVSLEKFLAAQTDKLNRKSGLFTAETLAVHDVRAALVGTPEQPMDFALVFCLRYLAAFADQAEQVAGLLAWLEREAYARLEVFVVRIQSVMRMKYAHKLVRLRRQAVEAAEFERDKRRHLVLIQSAARRFLSRRRVRKLAKEVLVKYVPHLQTPYYFNPRTGVKSFERPKILGPGEDCYSLAVPEKGLENVVYCYQCNYRLAVLYCQQCEDSMCAVCFKSLHFKGAKAGHSSCKIPHCSYCAYQIATKSCITCVTHAPAPGSVQASKAVFARGLYCDTCFLHEHDENTRALEASADRRNHLKRLLMNTTQAALVAKYLKQKIVTSHYFEALTTPCEECGNFSASWRCYSCNQIYCHRCLIHLHSINPIFAAHKLEQLSYYTPKMHRSLQKDLNTIYFTAKWERVKVAEREKQRLREHRMAVVLQAWWRMIFYRRRGLAAMQRVRRRQRKFWRIRQRETREVRATLSYRLRDLLGRAPPLQSDTMEERVLKRLSVFSRQTAREFIWRNLADWGHYRVTSKIPRKGVPKRGFDVGDFDELLEQARLLGYRLPGRVLVRTAENVWETTCDLSGLLRPGEIIRVKHYLFGVVSVDADSLRVNRLWREDHHRRRRDKSDGDSEGSEEEDEEVASDEDEDSLLDADGRPRGEVAYRMPTYRNERFQRLYRLKFFAYDLTIGNPLAQLGFWAYKAYNLRMMNFSLYLMRTNKRNKLYDESYQWKLAAVRYAENARKVAAFFATHEALVDLTAVALTDELRKRKFGDKSSVKSGRSRRKSIEEMLSGLRSDDEDEQAGDGAEGDGEDEEERPLLSGRSSKLKQLSQRKLRLSATGRAKSSTVIPTDRDDLEDHEDGQAEGDQLEAGDEERPLLSRQASRKKDAKAARAEKEKDRRKQSVLNMMDSLSAKKKAPPPVKTGPGAVEALGGKVRSVGASVKTLLEPEVEHVGIAKKNIKDPKYKTTLKLNKPEKPWYATREQALERKMREDRMPLAELAAEADDWKQEVDPMTENVYYLNDLTNEMVTYTPRAIHAKRQLEFEHSRNKKSFDDAQRRIQHLEAVTKNRLLISGYRKK